MPSHSGNRARSLNKVCSGVLHTGGVLLYVSVGTLVDPASQCALSCAGRLAHPVLRKISVCQPTHKRNFRTKLHPGSAGGAHRVKV